jgi:hypothetical protein
MRPVYSDLVEEMMRQVSTKVICGSVVAAFLCAACHADGLTEKQVKDLLEANNQILTGAMKENTETLGKAISENNKALINAISDSSATLSKNLTEAIEKLGTRIPTSNPNPIPIPLPTPSPNPIAIAIPSPPIYPHKQVRHVYAHKYVYCFRVIWEEDPCWWWW